MLSLFVVSRESELARVHELSCIDYNLFFFEVLLNGIAIVSVYQRNRHLDKTVL